MTADPILYAKARETRGWWRLGVFDAATGERLERVVEANAAEGWLVRQVTDEQGRLIRDAGAVRYERVERAILILRTFSCGAPIRPPAHFPPPQPDPRFTLLPKASPGRPRMTREPLRLVGPADLRCDCPDCRNARAYGQLTPHGAGRVRYRTPEDGLRLDTPEQGRTLTTRED